MDKKIDNAISAFFSAETNADKEDARQVLISLMPAYPKQRVDCDYWRMRHLVEW